MPVNVYKMRHFYGIPTLVKPFRQAERSALGPLGKTKSIENNKKNKQTGKLPIWLLAFVTKI